MSTNWTAVADQDSVDQLDSKIGNSTDGESQPTVFGKLLGIRNVVDWIKTTWTAAKAGLLDAAISSRAPASTALSTATWTATRAGKLDNLDGKISALPQGIVKSVQSGFKASGSCSLEESYITIAPVDAEKSIALTSGSATFSTNNKEYSASNQECVQLINDNTISVIGSSNNPFTSWVVVEFY